MIRKREETKIKRRKKCLSGGYLAVYTSPHTACYLRWWGKGDGGESLGFRAAPRDITASPAFRSP